MSNIKKFDQQVWINDKMSIGDNYQQEPRVTIDMSGKTDAIFVPVGNNSDRPVNIGNISNQLDTLSGNGFLRYNSETNKFEGYEELQWKNFITSNANMEFIPNYYINDLLEFEEAISDINLHYNGGNIYIAGNVVLTEDVSYDLGGVKFYGVGGNIYVNDENQDELNSSGYTITITNGFTTWTNVVFYGSGGNTLNNFSNYKSRQIFILSNIDARRIDFNGCVFADIVGGSHGPTPIIVSTFSVTGAYAHNIIFDNCRFSSHDGVSGTAPAPTYEGFFIKCVVNGGNVKIIIRNQSIPYINNTDTANLFGISGSCSSGEIIFNSDESAQITDSTYLVSGNDLTRTNTFYDNPTKISMLDNDYLFFNDSTDNYNNIRKITKANLLINSSNVQVEPDMSVQFANVTSLSGSSNFIYDYNYDILTIGSNINYSNYDDQIIFGDNNSSTIGENIFILGRGNSLTGKSNVIISNSSTIYGDDSYNYDIILGGKDNYMNKQNYSSILGGSFNEISGLTFKYSNSIISGSYNSIYNKSFSTIISCNGVTAIRSNLVHVPDLYIDNLSGQSANIIIDSNGILVTGSSSGMVQYLDDLLDVIAPSGSSNDGDYLIFDSSQNQWVASGMTGDELSAGTGISIDDSVSGYVIISATATGSYTLSADTGSGVVSDSDTITFAGDNIISTTYSNSAITISADLSDYLTGVTLTENQVAFGDSSNQITSSLELTWDDTYLKVSGSSSESVVISSTGSYYIGDPSIDGSWRFKINSSGNLVMEKYNGSSWELGQTISV